MNKTKNTKRALLTSGLALLLCVAMLAGSTFAWFTDSVTSAGNTIQSGTLQVDLIDDQGNSLEGKVLKFDDQDENDLWEPGCTYNLQKVFVKNMGNLALKYEIVINGIDGNAKLLEAIEWTVTVGNTTTELDDLKGYLLAGETSEAIVLSGHMKEEADNEYQGLTIEGISISVLATQYTYEEDSFNDQYDANAEFAAQTILKDIADVAAGETATIKLEGDGYVALDSESPIGAKVAGDVTLDLNGKTLFVKAEDVTTHQSLFHITKTGKLTVIGNGTIKMVSGKNPGHVTAIFNNDGGTLNIKDGSYSMDVKTYAQGSLIPTIVDTNSNVGAATTIIDGGEFYHTRNMFRNFAQPYNVASLIINGGTFNGEADDWAAIWNQKTSAASADGQGLVTINGGTFNYVEINNEFNTGVTIKDGVKVPVAVDNADKLASALATGVDVLYSGADLDIDESLTVKGNLTITNATIDADAAGEIVVDGGTLTLGEGAVISVDNEMPAGGVIRVIDNSEIILDGAEIKNCDNNGTGVLINVAAGAKMTIEDGTVISGNAVAGAGNTPYALIKVCGELTMNGGEIINNEFAHRALISIEGGKFVMNGGTIANNTFTGTGSTAIFYFFTSNAKFEMNGGTISDNNLGSNSSNAVFNSFSNSKSGALVVNGGTVKNNMAGGADRFAYIDGLASVSIAPAADVSGIVYDPWGVGTKDVNDIKQ